MSRLDDELRAAASQLAQDSLPPETLDEALDTPTRRSSRWAVAIVAAATATIAFAGGVLVGDVLPDPTPTPVPSVAPTEAAIESPPPVACESANPSLARPSLVVVRFPCDAPGSLEFQTAYRAAPGGRAPAPRLEAALRGLLDGPNDVERELGMAGVVPAEPGADLLASVEVQADGLALIDFDPALLDVPNLSTTNAGRAFLTALRQTAFELDEVTAIELSAGGSCDALFEFFQSLCQHFAKPVESFGDCPIVAPLELPSGAPITAPRSYPGEPMVSWGSGADTVTQLPGHRSGGPELPADGTSVEVRGYPGVVSPVGDTPESDVQIGWTEAGCTYLVWIRLGEGIDSAVDYAARYGPVVAAPSPPPAEAVTASVEDQGIRLTATLDRDVTVHGTRVTATTTVENVGADSVFWGHSGSCAFATQAVVLTDRDPDLDYGRTDWGGDAEVLKSVMVWVRPEVLDLGVPFQPAGWLDFDGQMGCTTDYVVSELPAGERLTHVMEWDTETWYGMPPPPGNHAVEVTFAFESRGQRAPAEQEPNPLSVRLDVPLAVIGPDLAYLSPGVAFDALLADETYRAELDSVARSDWTQSELHFEDGRWIAELYLGRDSEGGGPVPVIVGVVDAMSGDVLSVSREERERPPGG